MNNKKTTSVTPFVTIASSDNLVLSLWYEQNVHPNVECS